MLVTFTSQAHADIPLFGDVELAMLKMRGHSATVPGAILAADVPAALSRLKAEIHAEKASPCRHVRCRTELAARSVY